MAKVTRESGEFLYSKPQREKKKIIPCLICRIHRREPSDGKNDALPQKIAARCTLRSLKRLFPRKLL